MDEVSLLAGVRDSVTELGTWLRVQQPRILGALALLVVGWLLAVMMRAVAARIVRALGRMVPGRLRRRGMPQPSMEREVSDIIGLIAFWGVLLFFVAAAADALGMPVLGSSLAGIGFYLPRLLLAIMISVVGIIAGNLARDGVTAAAVAAGTPAAAAVGQIVRFGIIAAAALIAVAELGIDITLLTVLLSVTLLAVLGAFSLAFGLGARDAVSNIIGAHYTRQNFEMGQIVRVGDIEGTIVAITATAVIIRVPAGEVVIPAGQFQESIATLVTPGATR